MSFTPITPVLIIRNTSKYDVNILGRVKLRPGEQKDLYTELEYNEFGSLTSTVLKELESPSGEIYRLWKVLNAVQVIDFVNPAHIGSGVSADSFSTSNEYFEGAVLGFETGELRWLAGGGGGGGVSAVTASSPLASSGGPTPNLTIGGGTPGQVLTSDGGTSPTWADLPAKVSLTGDTMTGSLTMSGGATVTGLPAALAESDAISRDYAEDYFLGGYGSHTLLVQEGGQYATIQAAIDAAVDGDVILVGPKAAGWGPISVTSAKNITIAGYAQAATGQKLCRVSGIDVNISSGIDPNLCEINIVGLFVGASVAAPNALVRFTGAGSARLRLRSCGIFKSGTGDSIESSSSGPGSSFYIEDCFVNTQDVNGTTLKHVSGFTQVQGRSTLTNGGVVASCVAGDLVVVGCQLSAGATSAGPALQATGGNFTLGTSSVAFPKASGIGAEVSSGAILGVDQVSFLIGTGAALATGKAITGAGTLILGEATYGPAPVYSSVVDAAVTPAVKAGGALNSALSMSPNGGVTKLKITDLDNGTASSDAVNLSQLSAVEGVKYDQELFVAKNGSDTTGTGAVLKPFASISAAMAAITDASPTKRYAIRVETGPYTEASALNLKPNVFIIGSALEAMRITAPSFGLDATFTGAADNRSGIVNAILVGACSFDLNAVTSSQGKLFFQRASFTNAVTLNGNSAINQAQFDSCTFFGAITFSGVNVGVFANNRCFTSIVLNQHASVATILNATGGFADSLTATAAVDNFNRRCSVFTRGLKFDGTVTVDGPSAYVDYTVGSLPAAGATTLNGGNLVSVDFGANKALSNLIFPTAVNNPIMPATTNATNFGDWGKQWFWSFSYLHASTGTDCYLLSYPSAFGAESDTGKNVFLIADAAGLAADIDGGGVGLYSSNASGTGDSGPIIAETGTTADGYSGDITLTTGSVSGAGTRGVIGLSGRHVNVNSTKIVNLADGTNPSDAANVGQLNIVSLNTSSNAVVAGEAVCADSAAARTVKKADVSALATSRVIGIAVGDGKVQTAGIALASFTSAPSIGDAAYLSATTGQLTGTAPGSGIEAEVGIVVDSVAVDGKYAVALQIKKPV